MLTGAVGLPLAVAYLARRRRQPAPPLALPATRRRELAMLAIAALFAVKVVARGSLTLVDGVILVALYAGYARGLRGTPEEQPAVLGVPAGLLALAPAYRRPAIAALMLAAGAVVVTVAAPFATALLGTGTALGSTRTS